MPLVPGPSVLTRCELTADLCKLTCHYTSWTACFPGKPGTGSLPCTASQVPPTTALPAPLVISAGLCRLDRAGPRRAHDQNLNRNTRHHPQRREGEDVKPPLEGRRCFLTWALLSTSVGDRGQAGSQDITAGGWPAGPAWSKGRVSMSRLGLRSPVGP